MGNNKTTITQSVTKVARMKFTSINSNLDQLAIKNGVNCPGSGEILDKLIQKYGPELTMQDFFPDLFVGNELKQQS